MITQIQAKLLLSKFYSGTTTVVEEQLLEQFLMSDACPEEMQPDRHVFASLGKATQAPAPMGLGRRITDSISGKRRKILAMWSSVSAIVVVIITISVLHFATPVATVYADTCITPQQAAYDTQLAMNELSQILNEAFYEQDMPGGPTD